MVTSAAGFLSVPGGRERERRRQRRRQRERERGKGELESVRRAVPESDKTCMYNPAAVNAAAALSVRQTEQSSQPMR